MLSGKNSPLGSSGQEGAGKAWFAIGAWIGLCLALGRVAVIWLMEAVAHGADPTLVRSRLADLLPGILGLAFLVAWGGTALILLSRQRAHLRHAATLVLALASAMMVLGWWGADPSLQIGLDTGRGLLAAGCVAALGLGLALLASFLRARASSGRTAAIPLAIATAAWVTSHLLEPGAPERMLIRSVVSELHGAEEWEVVRSLPGAAPHAGVLCPSTVPARDGADMPSLIMPPPAHVRFHIGEPSSGLRWLTARAGIDQAAFGAFDGRLDGLAVEFQIMVDGRPAFEAVVPIAEESAWISAVAAGGAGIKLSGASTVELRTRLVDAQGETAPAPGAVPAGFGGLNVERRDYERRTRSSPQRPNIVLIVMDTQRADRTSAFGYERPTTPNLASLAARGVAFDSAYATSSWTWPSTASILTGLHPQEHGVTDKRSCFLPQELETLAEALQGAGFSTAAWSANPLIVANKNFDQGFEFFDASSAGGLRRSDTLVPAALDWLELMAGWRFFLYLHLVDPHAPLTPLAAGRERFAPDVPRDFDPRSITEYARRLLVGEGHAVDGTVATEQAVSKEHQRWISDLYDACTWSGDHWVGQVLEKLEDLDLVEQTIVVVTSDHGEELFDHGLAAHGHSLHSELLNVPLVLAGPGLPVGRRLRTPVSNRHLAPTLARLGGAELADLGPPVDLLAADAGDPAPVFFSTTVGWWNGVHPQPLLGLRDGAMVVHFAPEGGAWRAEPDPGGQVRLFDLSVDPGERRNLAPGQLEDANRLRRRAEQLARIYAERRRLPQVQAGGATLEELRALGYAEE